MTALLKMDIPQAQINALYDTRSDYVSLQKEQMQAGEKSDGFIIGIYKNPAYAMRKSNPVAQRGFVDLKDRGDFYAEIFAQPDDNGLLIDSTDWKSDSLQKKYGATIFGLNSKFKVPYVNKLQTPFIKYIEIQLNYGV